MSQLKTYLDTQSFDFQKDKERYLSILEDYRKKLKKVYKSGGDKAVAKHRERGKLLPRERIEKLVDPGTPFLELSPLAAYEQYDNAFPSAGIVTGIGVVQNKETVIIVNDATVKGGTYVQETIKKHVRAQVIAMEYNLPVIYMVDSGGVFLPEQSKVFPDKEDFGRLFRNQAKLSSMGVPQISIVMGSCTAGGAYIPAMSDESIIVRNQGTIFIGGPPLVKAATGEEVTDEELGGAEVHTQISGLADHIAEDDLDAIEICRDIFSRLPKSNKQPLDITKPEEPLYNPDDLYGLAPVDLKKEVNVREIIMRIVDGSKLREFKKDYGTNIVTGFARIMGYPAGVIANNGVIYGETARKAAHFIELCKYRNIPLVFLQNISGFIVGKKYEHGGIARDGAKLIHAVANANVPKFTIIFGGSFGAGNYAMAGRAFDPGLLFTWPNAKISVMGGEQAASVLTSIKKAQLKKSGKEINTDKVEHFKTEMLKKYEHESSAYYSTSRIWDDGIIDPTDTRKVLGIGIAVSRNAPYGRPQNGVFRM
ncbi:MAG: carboxyl transferase domain-containing protein [Bacteroidales bacterium]